MRDRSTEAPGGALLTASSVRLAAGGSLGLLVAELGRITVAEGGATEALEQVARLAAAAVPGTAAALVRVVQRGARPLVAATSPLLLAEEDGAAAEGSAVARFSGRRLRVPLGERGTLGALLLVARGQRFDEEAAMMAGEFARHAVSVVANTARLAELERLNRQLEEALSTRDVIGQAKGVLRERFGYGDQAAFDELRRGSQRKRQKLREIAEVVVESAGRGKVQ